MYSMVNVQKSAFLERAVCLPNFLSRTVRVRLRRNAWAAPAAIVQSSNLCLYSNVVVQVESHVCDVCCSQMFGSLCRSFVFECHSRYLHDAMRRVLVVSVIHRMLGDA